MKALFDSVTGMGAAMSYHRARHNVLAGNVANVDTPEYRPFDLERESLLVGDSSFRLVIDDDGASVGGDGNTVNLERELAKIDANRVRYTATSELVSRRLALLRYAATDGNG